MTNSFKNFSKSYWMDILISFLLGAIFACAAYQCAKSIPAHIIATNYFDAWFEADIPRVYASMTDRFTQYNARANVHPLFTIVAHPPAMFIKSVLNTDTLTSVRLSVAFLFFMWIVTFFAIFRTIGCRRLDTVLLTSLMSLSAGSFFWFTVPETSSYGSFTILLSILLVALSQRRIMTEGWYIAVNILTLGITITNWMAGIAATFVNFTFGRFVKILFTSFCIMILLWGVQKHIYPQVNFLLEGRPESRHFFKPESGGTGRMAASFFYHSLIMPEFKEITETKRVKFQKWPTIMMTQYSNPGSASVWGQGAVILWSVLLIMGLSTLLFRKDYLKFRIFLGLLFLGQLALSLIYGAETFLYALNTIAVLGPLVALSLLTKMRPVVLTLVCFLIPCVGINNYKEFNRAKKFVQNTGNSRQQVLTQMQLRPEDPWPRSQGHVVLGYPGSMAKQKGYHEPGGSFSPSVGSFGISILVTDKQGKILTTSDTIPLLKISQKFVNAQGVAIPGIYSETQFYQAIWMPVKPGEWTLTLKKSDPAVELSILLRSVGPAGGPVDALNWDNGLLNVNHDWAIEMNPSSVEVSLGDEREQGWLTKTDKGTQWAGTSGWGYAKINLSDEDHWSCLIKGPAYNITTGVQYNDVRSNLELNLPDEQFVNSLNAQVAHLLMGTVDSETRPGDPMSYPISWHREAAHIVVALAKSGQLEAARQLSINIAERDFSGGFGAESDAPGLSIWALTEVADRLNDPKFDQFIWAHVQRKIQFIKTMLSAKQAYLVMSDGLPLPQMQETKVSWLSVIATPAQDGLIIGKVQQHAPLFYINAVSYLGLINAASFAERLGDRSLSYEWRMQAQSLQKAWGEEIIKAEKDQNNPLTFNSALWPSTIAYGYTDAFQKSLLKRWEQSRTEDGNFRYPVTSTYFPLGEAHQWLFLSDTGRLWKTLQWFLKNQVSPGLYSWWDGEGEENTYLDWQNIRGWVTPKHMTPAYRTAAEMASLQIDMLGYLDKGSAEPTIIIGGGIPEEWLSSPMSVKGLLFAHRRVDWTWQENTMVVTIHGDAAQIKLGTAFPAGTPILVNYEAIQPPVIEKQL